MRVAWQLNVCMHGNVPEVTSCCAVQAPAHAQILSQLETDTNSAADGAAPIQNGHVSEALNAARLASGAAVGACSSSHNEYSRPSTHFDPLVIFLRPNSATLFLSPAVDAACFNDD